MDRGTFSTLDTAQKINILSGAQVAQFHQTIHCDRSCRMNTDTVFDTAMNYHIALEINVANAHIRILVDLIDRRNIDPIVL